MRLWRSWIASRRAAPPDSRRRSGETRDAAALEQRTLRPQLFLYFTLALLPIAAVSVAQGIERTRIDTGNVDARLIEAARGTASDENDTLASTERLLDIVAGFDEVKKMTPGCNYALGAALSTSRNVSNLTRIDAAGKVVCSALPSPVNASVAASPLFLSAKTAKGFLISGETYSAVLKRPMVAVILPLQGDKERFAGAVSATFDAISFDRLLRAHNLPKNAVIALFDRSRNVIAATDMAVARPVFVHAALDTVARNHLQAGLDTRGNAWTFVTTPLIGKAIFIGYAMPEQTLFGSSRLNVGTDFALPILMIAVAWLVTWYATDRLVTRWIAYLRRVAIAYRSGHYAVRPRLEDAPSEFKLLGEAMSDMATAIRDRDRELRDALDQKSTLVREVHHRVKNNLQIVMSLLNLQAGQVRDPAAKGALTQAQVRINALALVHRILHEIEGQALVDLKRLLEELTQQVASGLGAESFGLDVETDILPRQVTGDVAVALALLTVEALTNILKHAYPESGGGRISVSLRDIGAGNLRLAIEDNGSGFDPEQLSGRSVGARLIQTFGAQVGGTSRIRSHQGTGTVVELVFPDPDTRVVSRPQASVA